MYVIIYFTVYTYSDRRTFPSLDCLHLSQKKLFIAHVKRCVRKMSSKGRRLKDVRRVVMNFRIFLASATIFPHSTALRYHLTLPHQCTLLFELSSNAQLPARPPVLHLQGSGGARELQGTRAGLGRCSRGDLVEALAPLLPPGIGHWVPVLPTPKLLVSAI